MRTLMGFSSQLTSVGDAPRPPPTHPPLPFTPPANSLSRQSPRRLTAHRRPPIWYLDRRHVGGSRAPSPPACRRRSRRVSPPHRGALVVDFGSRRPWGLAKAAPTSAGGRNPNRCSAVTPPPPPPIRRHPPNTHEKSLSPPRSVLPHTSFARLCVRSGKSTRGGVPSRGTSARGCATQAR